MQSERSLILFVTAFAVLVGFLTIATPLFAASTEKVLYSFNDNGTDGYNPRASLIFDAAGNLYGTTVWGGGSGCGGPGCGTVFELTPGTGGTWTETVLHSFTNSGNDGGEPYAGLIFDAAGNLYGTTVGGGYGWGIVYELTPGAKGMWTESVLYTFAVGGHNQKGAMPFAGLIFDAAGNLYGTTSEGGASGMGCGGNGCGTVFQLAPGGTETVLHFFNDNGTDGYNPQVGLVFDTAGNLYGTTVYGGAHSNGMLFQLVPGRNGTWTEKVLCSFHYPQYPEASLILDAAGNLYGTTAEGGAHGYGTVFQLAPGTNGKWTEKVLHSFNANGKDGWYPTAGLIFDAAGNLYGTTTEGGAYGRGTAFQLAPGTNGKWTEKVLHSFGKGKDGVEPLAGLVFDAGNLYGTTYYGGAYGKGTVFEITP
jgi:uncharacterized repeat protein (TIGR03803 family)